MTAVVAPLERHRLRAPREHGDVYVEPAWNEIPALVAENVARGPDYHVDLLGWPLTQVAHQARRELLREATAYTGAYRDTPPRSLAADAPLLLAGHQPELFHPGVWFKNFALARLGRQLEAHAVNLLIDNDTVSAAAIRVPTGSVSQPRVQTVAFDRPASAMPYEQREILDRDQFASFAARAAAAIAPLVADPLVREFWPRAVEAARQGRRLGAALAQARHELEGAWGAETLELPLSRVCQFPAFRRFAVALLARLPQFRDVHNAALHDYRHVNRLRSRTHPVPELGQQQDWLEAPFWMWTDAHPQRQRVFARLTGDGIELTDQQQRYPLHLHADRQGDDAVEQLEAYEQRGVKLRPRALITTMFARLCLSDLFLHGIGGAKYDQLTDQIVTRFFGVAPPGFLTLSATARLPVEREVPAVEDWRDVQRQLRELVFHPERFLESGIASDLVAEKRRWIEVHDPALAARRHFEITRVNDLLQPFVARQRRAALGERDLLGERLRNEKILGSREYAFCLFPEATLRPLLLDK